MQLTMEQVQAAAELMAERFAGDPGIRAQMDGLERGGEILRLQCLGQVRAFAAAGCVTLLEGGPSFMMGYRTDELPTEALLGVLQDASRELLEAAQPEEIAELQAHVAPVAAISDEFWYLQRFGSEPVYVLQVVAVAPQLKGTGAFRRLIDPAIAACDAASLPIVLQTHNPANVPLYEHFGFELVEQVRSQEIELACYNMARVPVRSAEQQSISSSLCCAPTGADC